jgi:hypothetical protein
MSDRWQELKDEAFMDKIMDLFQKKLAWSTEQEKRQLSLAEKAEQNKTDFEYSKLNAAIKSDKDKLDFEEKKMNAGFKNGFDLEAMKQKGLVDLEIMKSGTDLQKAKWVKEAADYGHDTTLAGAMFGASKRTVKDANSGEEVTAYDPTAYQKMTVSLASTGLPGQEKRDYEDARRLNAQSPQAALDWRNGLDPQRKAALDKKMGITQPAPQPVQVIPQDQLTTIPTAPAPAAVVQTAPPAGVPLTPEEEARKKNKGVV